MPGRRTRQPVNYRLLDDEDSDDDFNVSTRPAKRPRAQKPSERQAEFADGAGPSNGRPSLDDKLFKKQIKIALEKSRSEIQNTADAPSQEHSIKSADTIPVSQDDVVSSLRNTAGTSQDITSQSSAGDEDEWAGGASASDESDESGSESSVSDEEFQPKKKQPTKSAKPKKTPAAKPSTPKASAAASSKSAAGRRSAASKGAGLAGSPAPPSRPVLKVVNSGARPPVVASAIRAAPVERQVGTPKWKPPGRVSEAAPSEKKLLSPSGGGLRLGLSRNVRLKPLHPSARPVT